MMKKYFATLLVLCFQFPQTISSSQCTLADFQNCLQHSSSPLECAQSSGCEPSVSELFANINAMKEPSIFRYTTNPNVEMESTEVNFDTLDHNEFRESPTHFPLSRRFTVTRSASAGDHEISLMMPTYFSDSNLCANKHIDIVPLSDNVPGSRPGARVENCQTMMLTSICLCFVNMHTEAGSFIMASKTRHPLTVDSSDTDLRRRLDDALSPPQHLENNKERANELDVDFITHTALVILTVVAFIGNGMFLTYVFCVSAV